jgi:hypothetical protein
MVAKYDEVFNDDLIAYLRLLKQSEKKMGTLPYM